ncbi:MAG TPA: hypothetical protein PLB62_02925 [Candidatus Sumerlaeota bacterium]|nr:hypothetical protein [Candidatus Sumerlaeota bacterium]
MAGRNADHPFAMPRHSGYAEQPRKDWPALLRYRLMVLPPRCKNAYYITCRLSAPATQSS